MSISSSVLFTFRKWLNRFFGFQTYKVSERFSRSDNMARYYSLCLVVLIVVIEALNIYYSRPLNTGNYRIPDLTVLLLSVTTAIGAALAILSDSFFCASEKVKQYKNFQQIHTNLLYGTFTQTTAISNTNTAFTVLITIKGSHMVAASRALQWNKFAIFLVCRPVILTLMVLRILTDICTCKFHVKCIKNKIICTYSQQLSAQNGIDFRATSFGSTTRKEGQEEKLRNDQHNSDINIYIKIYALIIENLKIISKRFKYAVGLNKKIIFLRKNSIS